MLPVAVRRRARVRGDPAGTRSWTDRSGTICATDATTATGGGRSLRAGLFLPAPLGFLPTPWWLAPDSHQARCHHGHCLRFERCANPAGSRTGVGRRSDEDASPGRAARLRRLAADKLLGAASASGWAPVFHGESREDLRPVFLPVTCDDEHAFGDDAGLEDGSNRRDQLRAVPQGYRRPGGVDILDSTLDRVRPSRSRRRRAGALDQILELVLEGFPCPLGHLNHVSRSFHVSAWNVLDGAG